MKRAVRPDRANHLLRQLSVAERSALQPYLEEVDLLFKEELFEQNEPMGHIYFPTAGVLSLVTLMKDDVIETGTIGREGFLGVPALLGARLSPGRAFVQVQGSALRMKTRDMPAALDETGKLRSLLLLYSNALMAMIAQSAACNRVHDVDERMARWLLMTHDRVDGDDFLLTQSFLGCMLGVRRPTVNVAGRRLQAQGYIRYTRGRIHITDRRGLEGASCECYAFVTKIMSGVRVR
jgi:CRP-like cAMP-binding protein